ncbi:homeodomain-interacting protein kinase 2-like [Solea senegalensis]|uniref:Homeodomain-interacting protein kinase 2-like n=1 Tax=Solea senegalensis TaxID=28829 RepID=A0AAV6RJ46_SOLSE|nr:homeodomain-interacting protein kinase 2-like [Solea senegalensis]
MILQSRTSVYQVMDFQGEGTYGQVIKCSNLHTSEVVAVKIHKQDQQSFMRELKVLEVVRALDPDKMNIVRFIEYFRSGSLHCMAFEMLDRSLCDLMDERNGLPLSLNEIRPVTHQLLVALEALNNIGIMHRDLKLDNIMLVNHKYEPFRIKVIDFGFALPIWQGMDPEIIQNLSVRAPEVNLGLPLSEAVDMWSVGCIMAHLYFGYSLFPFKCVYNWMETMLCLLGWPSHEMLIAGKYSNFFFVLEMTEGWRLKSPHEFLEEANVECVYTGVSCFDLDYEVENSKVIQNELEYRDRMAFLDILKCCLHLEAQHRINPSKALTHHFVTMVHMVDALETSSYGNMALNLMIVSPLDNLEESESPSTETYDDEDSESFWDYLNHSHTKIPSHAKSCKSPHAFYSGLKDTADLAIEELGTCDRGSDDCGPTDGAVGSISPNTGDVTAVRPVDVNTCPEGGPRRSLFQKTRNVFRRLWQHVVSGK